MAIEDLSTKADLQRFVESVLAGSDTARRLRQVGVFSGTGSPNGVISAPVGTLYRRLDGGAATSLYVKESGVGNTGWVGK